MGFGIIRLPAEHHPQRVCSSAFLGVNLCLRYCGALCDLAYVFAPPSLVYIFGMRGLGQLTPISVFVHVSIIAIGVANFIVQFLQ
ncbi:putative sodium-coupled neutral amino acid transporter 9-like [Tropilaelaps mercedesae]|uniref:Putative sodium-coupled neutral amino acid transporter 9-like n=1 Tax=Tropilaelaps mercedesae TaxID=418985 RepID=A0A1V9X823_9ACAR|nr:putative sodium-coupled neutral amino acid transporter 9-like [Tropilaelaps mercedesae]